LLVVYNIGQAKNWGFKFLRNDQKRSPKFEQVSKKVPTPWTLQLMKIDADE
jgi:hypothetical protein